MYRVALTATAVSVLFAATSGHADELTETQRWAIVAARDLQGSGLVHLLTAKLSQDESLQLVERADVAGVLDELSLQASGLVDPKLAVKFGKILSANAILVIDKAADDDEAWLHARLVETKSGIRLWSGLAPQVEEDDDDMCGVIVKRLRLASRKMETDGKRCYVGILNIKSEDLDSSCDIFTATIRLMLEHDLQQSPQLVVLEREQALRLFEERDLTGIDLELRGATTPIEGGVRRVAASGDREVSLRFIATTTGVAKSISVAFPGDDWGLARCKLRRECLKAIVTSQEMEAAATGPGEISVPRSSATGVRQHPFPSYGSTTRTPLDLSESNITSP